MSKNIKINLDEVKANYSFSDINLVDLRDINFANEVRLYYEIFFGIGLTLLGVLIVGFDWYLFATTCIFLFAGIANLIRYISRVRKLRRISEK